MTVVRFGFAHCVCGGQFDKNPHSYSMACCLAVCSMTSMLLSLSHAHFAEEVCGTKFLFFFFLKKKKVSKFACLGSFSSCAEGGQSGHN